MSPAVTRRPVFATSPALLVAALLSALLAFATMAVAAPEPASAAIAQVQAAKCPANLRTKPATSAPRKATINAGTKITISGLVWGSGWRTTCAGQSIKGGSWFKISAVNGRSVSSRYGVKVLYAASGLFRATTQLAGGATAQYAAAKCTLNLRSKPSTSAPREGAISSGTKVTISSVVYGGSWRASCGGSTVKGTSWYRITAVNGRSVSSRYGVKAVYAASGLFRGASAPAPAQADTQTYYAQCDGVTLRQANTTDSRGYDSIAAGTSVTVVASVHGASWSATCGGREVAGTGWRKISHVDGKSVSSLFGVSHVYTALGLLATTRPKPPVVTEGIDVSHWQGSIDWTKVRAAGKRFVFIKASENTSFVDDRYAANRAGAKAAGLLVGAYHFARPGSGANDAIAEADHFARTAKIAKGDLLPVLDLEVTGGLSPTALQGWTKSFLQRLYERTGVRAVLYVAPSFWKTNMGDTDWFAKNGYKVLWDAHWTSGSAPSVPGDNWGGHGWTFWQYSSTGRVSGISGNVDLNRYNGTDFSRVRVP